MSSITDRLELYRSFHQTNGRDIHVNDLRNEVRTRSMPNVDTFKYLLRNQHLIPAEWEDNEVHFLDTKHLDGDCGPSIYVMYKGKDGKWHSKLCFLDHFALFRSNRPIVLFKQKK